jgi:hypothetical protein
VAAGHPPADPELLSIVEDFELLWTVAGFAELFSARLASGLQSGEEDEPTDVVLAEHRRQLLRALRRGQRRGEIRADREPAQLADALVGFYLSRRLGRRPVREWAREALGIVLR